MDTPSITLESWPTFHLPKEEVKATLQYLAHKMQKPVTFRWYTEGEGYSDQRISIRVFVNDHLAATYRPDHVTLHGQPYLLSANQCGMAAALVQNDWKKIVDEEDQCIGCLDRNRIILPIEITAADNPAARAILGYVVEQAIPLLDFDLGTLLKDREESFTRQFTASFQESVRSRFQTRQEEFNQRKRDAEQAYYTLLDFERERGLLEQELTHLAELSLRTEHPLARQQAKALLQIQQSGQYRTITLEEDGILKAVTSPITIEHDGYSFPLGPYEIAIPANGDLRIKALEEHPEADHPHPHVARDFRPCLGNIAGDVAKLIGKMRYGEVLQLLHSFLSSYNPENPYEKIGHFDPEGNYPDDEADPCEDCDEKCSPYCIFDCTHNNECYTCSDCNDHRTEYCYEECEYNRAFERFHPCEGCTRQGERRCYQECSYNESWQLQDPCEGCEEAECTDQCPYKEQKESLAHAQ